MPTVQSAWELYPPSSSDTIFTHMRTNFGQGDNIDSIAVEKLGSQFRVSGAYDELDYKPSKVPAHNTKEYLIARCGQKRQRRVVQ
ncbi:hypothetical protein ABHI18_003588 [Aspergillus niger]